MSPKIWQLAQAESPWLELNEASYKKRRPLTTRAGSIVQILCLAAKGISGPLLVSFLSRTCIKHHGGAKPMTTRVTHNPQDTTTEGTLFVAFELSEKTWKLGFTTGHGQKPRERSVSARQQERVLDEIA